MKTLFFDCNFGAAGDMITAALLELFDDREKIAEELNSIGIPGVRYVPESVERSGIIGTHMSVLINGEEESDEWEVHGDEHEHGHHHHDHDHEHHHEHNHEHNHDHYHHHHDHDHDHYHHHHDHDHDHDHEHEHCHREHDHYHEHEQHHVHRGMNEIEEIISALNVSDSVKENALSVYEIIADAESKAHGHPVEDVHFHEVGRMDAIADVTAVCFLIEKIAPGKIVSSPIAVGNGYVKCAHGIMSVPAPATLNILHGVPSRAGIIPTESCTPTGAALMKHFVDEFTALPEITVEKVGYGMGGRVFPGIAGGIRAILGV